MTVGKLLQDFLRKVLFLPDILLPDKSMIVLHFAQYIPDKMQAPDHIRVIENLIIDRLVACRITPLSHPFNIDGRCFQFLKIKFPAHITVPLQVPLFPSLFIDPLERQALPG